MTGKSFRALLLVVASLWLIAAGDAIAQERGAGEGVRAIGVPHSPLREDKTRSIWTQASGPSDAAYRQFEHFAAAEDWGEARDFVYEQRLRYPQWHVPAGMELRLSAGLTDLQIRNAVDDKDWKRALYFLGDPPGDECENGFKLWARVDALAGLADTEAQASNFAAALSNCPQHIRIALLGRATQSLDADGLESILDLPLWHEGQLSDKITAALGNVRQSANRMRYDGLLAAGDDTGAAEFALASGDVALQRQAGWNVLDTNADMAAKLFTAVEQINPSPEGHYGLGLAYFRAGLFEKALAVLMEDRFDFGSYADDANRISGLSYLELSSAAASDGQTEEAVTLALKGGDIYPALRPEAEEKAGAAWLQAALTAYNTGDYAGAELAARNAMRYPPAEREGRIRLAWVELKRGHADLALANFQSLYDSAPDENVLQGVVLAAEQAGQLKRLHRDKKLAPDLRKAAGRQLSVAAMARGDFYSAHYFAPDIDPRLGGVSGPAITQSVAVRRQDAGDPDGDMEGTTSRSDISWSGGRNRFAVGVVVLDTAKSNGPLAPTLESDPVWSPYFKVIRDGELTLEAELGTTPVGADISPVLIGGVGGHFESGGVYTEGQLFRRGRRDSALALYGTRATDSQPAYGRIVESGVSLQVRKQIADQVMVGAGATVSALDGRNVPSNSRADLVLNGARNIPLKKFSYFSTGPFVEIDSYDRNLNAYTPGYGGYFSPQTFTRAGWSLNFLTEELGHTLVRGDMSIAHESIEQDPLYGAAASRAGSKSSALSGAMDLSAGMMLNKNWILTGHLSGISSEAFEDVQVGIAFKYIPGGRGGLIRQDLAPDPFARDLWGR